MHSRARIHITPMRARTHTRTQAHLRSHTHTHTHTAWAKCCARATTCRQSELQQVALTQLAQPLTRARQDRYRMIQQQLQAEADEAERALLRPKMSHADVERMHARNVQVGRSYFRVRGCVAKSAAIAKGRRCVKQSEGESTRMRASCSCCAVPSISSLLPPPQQPCA